MQGNVNFPDNEADGDNLLKTLYKAVDAFSNFEAERNRILLRWAFLAGTDSSTFSKSDYDNFNVQTADRISLDMFRQDIIERGFSSAWADALYRTLGLIKSSYIHKYEYLLCIFALKANVSDHPAWVEFRYRTIFNYYAKKEDEMTAEELFNFLRENSTFHKILLPLVDSGIEETGFCDYETFVSLMREGKLAITIDDKFFHPRPHLTTTKVTLDNRLVKAKSSYTQRLEAMRTATNTETSDIHKSYSLPFDAKAPGLVIAPSLAPTSEWPRSSALDKCDDGYSVAATIMQNTVSLVHLDLMMEKIDMPGSMWALKGKVMQIMLGTSSPVEQVRNIHTLCKAVRKVLANQPTVVEVGVPCKIFGDIHGQFRDLLLLFCRYGLPCHRGGDIELCSYVFNGDFVDRGTHQIETVIFLFAMKLLYPTRVYLVRGNHEFRLQNRCMSRMASMGFDRACLFLYGSVPGGGDDLFEVVHAAFDMLPFAAVVQNSIAVMHGGLGDGKWTLNDLRAVSRPVTGEMQSSMLFNIVWSDPIPEIVMDARRGVHLSERDNFSGRINLFAKDVTEQWCRREGISVIVRSHEYVPAGFMIMHEGRCITVFSARNYMDSIMNDSALLLVNYDDTNAIRVRIKTLAQRSSPETRVNQQFRVPNRSDNDLTEEPPAASSDDAAGGKNFVDSLRNKIMNWKEPHAEEGKKKH